MMTIIHIFLIFDSDASFYDSNEYLSEWQVDLFVESDIY